MKTAFVKRLLAAACAALAALSAWHATKAAGGRDDSQAQSGAKRAEVEELFVQRCARCHGRDGRGKTKLGEMVEAPDFTDADWWEGGVSDARLRTSLQEGKGEMPAFGKKLSRSEISSLAAYVRAFAPDRGKKR